MGYDDPNYSVVFKKLKYSPSEFKVSKTMIICLKEEDKSAVNLDILKAMTIKFDEELPEMPKFVEGISLRAGAFV